MAGAMETFSASQDHVATVVKLQSSRIDAIQNYTIKVQRDMREMEEQIRHQRYRWNMMYELHLRMAQMLQDITMTISDLDSLYNAIQRLFAGNLTPHLVPHENINQAIIHLVEYLKKHHPHLTVLYQNPLHYYRTSNFVVFRRGHDIYLNVDCPLSSMPDEFILHKVERIPLATPGSTGFYSLLETNIKALAITDSHYVEIYEEAEIFAISSLVQLNNSPMQIRNRSYSSCATAMMSGNHDLLQKLCTYTVVNAPLPPQIIRLSTSSIYISNITKLIIDCDSKQIRHNNTVGKQMVLTIPCACEVIADSVWIPRTVQSCDNSSRNANITSTSFYSINYMFLKQFLQEDMQSISPEVMYSKQPNISLPQLKLHQQEYSNLLALSDNLKFEISQVINATKADQSAFQSVGHVALQQLLLDRDLDSSFNLLSTRDWAIALLSCATVTLTLMTSYLLFKFRALSAIVFLSHRAGGANALSFGKALQLAYTLPTTTVADDWSALNLWMKSVEEILPIEIAILMFMIAFITVSFALKLYRYYKKQTLGPQAFCFVQIGNISNAVNIKWGSLALPPEFYSFHSQAKQCEPSVSVITSSWPITSCQLTINAIELGLENPSLDLKVALQRSKAISFWQARKALKMMQSDYFVVVVLTDNRNNVKSCLKVRSLERLQDPRLARYPALPGPC